MIQAAVDGSVSAVLDHIMQSNNGFLGLDQGGYASGAAPQLLLQQQQQQLAGIPAYGGEYSDEEEDPVLMQRKPMKDDGFEHPSAASAPLPAEYAMSSAPASASSPPPPPAEIPYYDAQVKLLPGMNPGDTIVVPSPVSTGNQRPTGESSEPVTVKLTSAMKPGDTLYIRKTLSDLCAVSPSPTGANSKQSSITIRHEPAVPAHDADVEALRNLM
jgi:hypothetical protein